MIQLRDPPDDHRWLVKYWQKASLAAHDPAGYVQTVQTMFESF
jgi:hypothetical protein